MILLGYLYSIKSTRKLIDEIRYNIVYRWFCGLTIQDKLPHHASFSRIKQRFKKIVFENIFLNSVHQCQQAGLIEVEMCESYQDIFMMTFLRVKKQMKTEVFKQKLCERLWKIEGVMNELKNHNGLLRAKYRGIENIQIQAYMAAIAINIKRIVFLHFFYFALKGQNLPPFTTGRYRIYHKSNEVNTINVDA